MRESIFKPSFKNKVRVFTEFYRLGFSGAAAFLRSIVSRFIRSAQPSHWYYYYMTLLNSRMHHVSYNNDIVRMTGSRGVALARTGDGYSDLECFNQIFGREEYSEFKSLLTRYFDGKANYIVDAGANVGYSTLFFKSLFPESHIVSIEPEKENFNQLKQNCEANDLTTVTMVNAGVWNKSTFLKLIEPNPALGSWAYTFQESTEPTAIYAEDFDGLIKSLNWPVIDILKIDIEGTEAILFENGYMDRLLSMTKVIGIEIHSDRIDGQKIVDNLKKAGFVLYTVGDMHFGHNTNMK